MPTPPRKPKSSTRTQSARQNGTNATRPARASRGRPLKNSPPMVARTTTAKRLTAHPWAATKFSKDETHEDRNPGCGVWAIVRTMPVSVPPRPCQKPRPGHACSTAIPIRNTPLNPSTTRPRRGGGVGPFGQRDRGCPPRSRRGRHRVLRRARSPPGRRCRRRPRRRPTPRDPNPGRPSRRTATTDRVGATRSHSPIPTWIHTVADAAWIGWFDQMAAPLFTRCCTQPGDALAEGWITPVGSPRGIEDWICSSPSKIQSAPKPIRSIRRAIGSGEASDRDGKRGLPVGLELPVLDGAEHVEADCAQHNEHKNDDELMKERCVEAREDERVARLESASHAGHRLLTSLGRS